MNALATIAERLRARIGLDPAAMGRAALDHAVRLRTRARQLGSPAAYLEALAADAAEWDALVEALAVPETWFFRDRAPFVLLAQWAVAARARGAAEGLAILSLPCASGEEAWSIAIALAAAGLPPSTFRIDAIDLSQRALAIARAGEYGARALRGHRGVDPAWTQYLEPLADGRFAVAARLRSAVHFARGNLLELGRTFAGRRFDCIFSRNLLIYCDDPTRAAALDTFAALLAPDGLLVLGHAETVPAGTPGFVREKPLSAFAWRRVADIAPPKRSSGGRPARPAHQPTRARRPRPAVTQARKSPDDLAHARQLADRGALAEAAARAAARIQTAPADAAAHALLGIVRAAQSRDDEAVEHLRRALYIDPAHEEALVHLALVLDRRGDAAGAARLRDRARRLGT